LVVAGRKIGAEGPRQWKGANEAGIKLELLFPSPATIRTALFSLDVRFSSLSLGIDSFLIWTMHVLCKTHKA